jgi:C-terminal processing protease CtpA/Prc
MKQIGWIVLVLMASALPAVADTERCTEPDAQTCLDHMVARHHRGWLGLEYERSEEGTIRVREVTPHSPASKGGFQVSDVLLSINGADFSDPSAVKKARGDWLPGQTVTYTIRRGTTLRLLTVKLGRMPEKSFVEMVGRHMLENHVSPALAAIPGAGIEVTAERSSRN